MKILIVEDDFSFSLSVEILIESLGHEHVGTIDNGNDALIFIKENTPDLILMDIDLNGFLSGVDIARKISELKIPVIFMTTYSDESIYEEAMLTNPNGYIVKPFDKISLRSHIDRVVNLSKIEEAKTEGLVNDCFFVKVNDVLKKIEYHEVCWIQSDRNYADIFLEKKRYTAKISLSKLETQLYSSDLIRVHKQYIINVKKIQGVTSNDIIINDKTIPLGAKFKNQFLSKLNKI